MTPAIQGIVSDLCHALGIDAKQATRISIMPNRVVVDLVDHARMISYTKTFDGPAVVQAESLARREQRAAARHAD